MSRVFRSRHLAITFLLFILLGSATASATPSATAMVAAGQRFANSLTAQQRQQVVFPLDSDELFKWNVVPDQTAACTGLPLKAMTTAQRTLADNLLKAGLSEKGYATSTGIMELENVLRGEGKARNAAHDPLAYCFSLFGMPAADADWGWRVDGHHLSLHFTIIKGNLVSTTPIFAGTSPAEVRTGKQKGVRLLAEQEDTARAMLMALTPEERAKAIIGTAAPDDIVTGNKDKIDPMKPAGLSSKEMTPEQRLQLIGVVKTYAALLADDLARERVDRIYSAGVDQLSFAWAGGAEAGQKHYYRIQGPTFVIEFDNSQDDANHVHAVWRDFAGDFGRDLLRGRTTNTTH